MAYDEATQAALDRLRSLYNSEDRTAANPGGFGNFGHQVNFDAFLADFVLSGKGISDAINTFGGQFDEEFVETLNEVAAAIGDGFASIEQGAKADTAVQPGQLANVALTGAYSALSGRPTLGGVAALEIGTTAGTVAAGNDSRITNAVQSGELGNSATRNVGTAANTVAAGNDARIVGAVQNTRTVTGDGGLAGGGTLEGDIVITLDADSADRLRKVIDLTPEAVFRPSAYLSDGDFAAARVDDVGGQNATNVTAALRVMIDAAVSWLQGGNDRHAICDFGTGTFAINDELVSPETYAKIWSQTDLGQNKRLTFRASEANSAKIKLTGFAGATITRASGPFSGIASPRAVLPLHLPNAWRLLFAFQNLKIVGERALTDPIGVYGWNLLETDMEGIYVQDLANSAYWIEGCYNSRWNNLTAQSCGVQPTQGGIINGSLSGLHKHTARFTVADNGNGTATITANEDWFAAAHQTNSEYFEVAEARTVFGGPQPSLFRITTVTNATTAIATPVTAGTIRAVSDQPGTFLIMRCSGSANSASITLTYPLPVGISVGEYVSVYSGGSKTNTVYDTLVARITAISGDRKTLTLSHQLRRTVSNKPLVIRPSVFLGVTEDGLANGNTVLNDVRITNTRIENSHGYIDSVTSAVQLVAMGWDGVSMSACKTHASNQDNPNWGQSGPNMILDNLNAAVFTDHHVVHGHDLHDMGAITICGEYTKIDFGSAHYGSWRMTAEASVFYIDPQTADIGKCQVQVIGGRMTASESSLFPNTSQVFVRGGANYLADMVRRAGRIQANRQAEMDAISPPGGFATIEQGDKADAAVGTAFDQGFSSAQKRQGRKNLGLPQFEGALKISQFLANDDAWTNSKRSALQAAVDVLVSDDRYSCLDLEGRLLVLDDPIDFGTGNLFFPQKGIVNGYLYASDDFTSGGYLLDFETSPDVRNFTFANVIFNGNSRAGWVRMPAKYKRMLFTHCQMFSGFGDGDVLDGAPSGMKFGIYDPDMPVGGSHEMAFSDCFMDSTQYSGAVADRTCVAIFSNNPDVYLRNNTAQYFATWFYGTSGAYILLGNHVWSNCDSGGANKMLHLTNAVDALGAIINGNYIDGVYCVFSNAADSTKRIGGFGLTGNFLLGVANMPTGFAFVVLEPHASNTRLSGIDMAHNTYDHNGSTLLVNIKADTTYGTIDADNIGRCQWLDYCEATRNIRVYRSNARYNHSVSAVATKDYDFTNDIPPFAKIRRTMAGFQRGNGGHTMAYAVPRVTATHTVTVDLSASSTGRLECHVDINGDAFA